MKTGFYYSFFRLNKWFIPLYKFAEVFYAVFFFRSSNFIDANGIGYYSTYFTCYRAYKKEPYTAAGHFRGNIVQFIIIVYAYAAYYLNTFFFRIGVPIDTPPRNPKVILIESEEKTLLFRGIISFFNNRIIVAHRAKSITYTYKSNSFRDLVPDTGVSLNTSSSFIRTAGSLPAWGARQILGLRVKAAAGMALTSFLPAAVLFFNQTQSIVKAATAVLLKGGRSCSFCRLGLFGPFTAQVSGLFLCNRNSL